MSAFLKKYKIEIFQDGRTPSVPFNDLLFFRPDFHVVNIGEQPSYVIASDNSSLAVFIFFEEGGALMSSKNISFGGFYFSKFSDEKGFVLEVVKMMQSRFHSIFITLPPESYFQNSVYQLLEQKCLKRTTWINNHLIVLPNEHLFEKWSYSDLKKYRKCERSLFYCRKLDSSSFESLYDVIQLGWEKKGFELSMGKNHLAKVIENFPKEYLLYAVYDGMDIISGAVIIRVTSKILYVFYLGFNPDYKDYSPNRFLMNHIYDEARKMGVEQIDLGTSINEGVREFKKRLGCKESYKYRFEI